MEDIWITCSRGRVVLNCHSYGCYILNNLVQWDLCSLETLRPSVAPSLRSGRYSPILRIYQVNVLGNISALLYIMLFIIDCTVVRNFQHASKHHFVAMYVCSEPYTLHTLPSHCESPKGTPIYKLCNCTTLVFLKMAGRSWSTLCCFFETWTLGHAFVILKLQTLLYSHDWALN